jgi:hypothetical protein
MCIIVNLQLKYAQQEHLRVKLQRILQWHIKQRLTVWKQQCVCNTDMKRSIRRAHTWYQHRQTKQGLARLVQVLQQHRVTTSSKQETVQLLQHEALLLLHLKLECAHSFCCLSPVSAMQCHHSSVVMAHTLICLYRRCTTLQDEANTTSISFCTEGKSTLHTYTISNNAPLKSVARKSNAYLL